MQPRRLALIAPVLLSLVACDKPTTPAPAKPPVGSAAVGSAGSAAVGSAGSAAAGSAAVATPGSTLPAGPTMAAFAGKLHAVAATGADDALYSPVSIALALAMTREGARGATAIEMNNVIGDAAVASAKALIAQLAATPSGADAAKAPVLAIANRLYADPLAPLVPAFVEITRRDYLAPIEATDFATGFEASRARINTWVAGATRDKIRDLLAPGTLNDRTRLVLVNALYLKAQWASAFKPEATTPSPFQVDGGAKVDVPTMHGKVAARWGALHGARMLDLPYAAVAGGPKLAMLLVVPDTAGLGDVEAKYSETGLPTLLAAITDSGDAEVALPRFTLGGQLELTDALGKLGMPGAFTDAADFSGISATPLKISKVIHKAWAEVDEAGTEAAAATAVVMMTKSVVQTYAFAVDRSFLAFIHDDAGNVLFAARVMQPKP